jgi:glycosyltransferase involved in cell wall biosynthesis
MKKNDLPIVLVISSYPPRVCGIATYTQDLISALQSKYNHAFSPEICALQTEHDPHDYTQEVTHVLNTSDASSYTRLADAVNSNINYSLVVIQHEFGLFNQQQEALLDMIRSIKIPVIITFHTVFPNPDEELKSYVQQMARISSGIIVMTQNASWILKKMYHILTPVSVIQHGTHLVAYKDKKVLKHQYGFTGKKVLATFGLISSGKNIETTLRALPAIIKQEPDVLFLIIGRTHPNVIKAEGETYREKLQSIVAESNIGDHVKFINDYLPLPQLLDYLQLTDIYLFTSKDPNQAVSGTFSYAMSCGCPIVSTRIPHAVEWLGDDSGIIIDFEKAEQLSNAVNRLLKDPGLRENMRLNGLHKTASTAWENVAIAHAELFSKYSIIPDTPQFTLLPINLGHFKNLTTNFGMIQFSKINQPDFSSGYTLDDNARALVAACMYYSQTRSPEMLRYISIYLNFIRYCAQPNGTFLNYLDINKTFTEQNSENLDDANGRTIWALGYLLHHLNILPVEFITTADSLMKGALKYAGNIYSSRSLGFIIKGLYYYNSLRYDSSNIALADTLATRLERMYAHESDEQWHWFESYLTYANSILPESMLCAYLMTQNETYKRVANDSFKFLLDKTFPGNRIRPVSNNGWLHKGKTTELSGQQPIDVSYTIMALERFYMVSKDKDLLEKMFTAFSWFHGNNHLNQIVYNPCTGGCYDGLEKDSVNLNQGAESTVSYLMACLTIKKHEKQQLASEAQQKEINVYTTALNM